MSSFKLQDGGGAKKQATSIGALLIVLGIIGGYAVDVRAFLLIIVGILLLIGGAFASE